MSIPVMGVYQVTMAHNEVLDADFDRVRYGKHPATVCCIRCKKRYLNPIAEDEL